MTDRREEGIDDDREAATNAVQVVRAQTGIARDVLASLGHAASHRLAERIVLSAYKADRVADLNGRTSGGVAPEAWSVPRHIAGLEKHAGLDRMEARDAADALTDAIVPDRWTIRRLRRMAEADPILASITMADLHRHSDGRNSGLTEKMADLGAITVGDVARLGHSLPPGWLDRTFDRLRVGQAGKAS